MEGYTVIADKRLGSDLTVFQEDEGETLVAFQHGLCGDAKQPAEVFPKSNKYRHIVMECRGHGNSIRGESECYSLSRFALDFSTIVQTCSDKPIPIGGISMGAVLALNLAVTKPSLVSCLILVRPAWFTSHSPENLKPFCEVAKMISRGENVDSFYQSVLGKKIGSVSPDNLATLSQLFARHPLEDTVRLLSRISSDGPAYSVADLENVSAPTLVVTTEHDPIHPASHAVSLAHTLPNAQLAEVTSKSKDREAYINELRALIYSFLESHTKTDHETQREPEPADEPGWQR